MERIAVVAPHMDDDVLGCGGLMALRARLGLPGPTIIYLSDGTRGTPTLDRHPSLNATRKAESLESLKALGVNGAVRVFLDLPDNEIKADKKTAGRLAEELARARPEWILANSPLDSHPDHRAASRLLAMALEDPGIKKMRFSLCLYEIYSPWPLCRVLDITEAAKIKQQAIRAHASQLKLHPYDEHLMGLNRFRGLQVARLGEKAVRFGEGYLPVGLSELRDLIRGSRP
jgi:LmbE family N-acetylglucosaminyl deacetylase